MKQKKFDILYKILKKLLLLNTVVRFKTINDIQPLGVKI
jgi:hypothetical protein